MLLAFLRTLPKLIGKPDKNQLRNCLKMEAWTVCRFKGRGQEIEGWCLGGVVNTPMHTMYHDVLS